MSDKDPKSDSPQARGFRWPAEWARHEATLLAWPHDSTTFPGGVERAEAAFALFAAAVSRSELVHLLVGDQAMEKRARVLLADSGARAVRLHRMPTADVWIRDYGPITLVRSRAGRSERLSLDFTFNAWGGKYEELCADDAIPAQLEPILGIPREDVDLVLEGGSIEGDGRGTLLTTEQCLLNENRNPHLDRAGIEEKLRTLLGVRTILWLGEGVIGDDTDGHVDDITRFVGPHKVLTAIQPDPNETDHAPLAENRRRLASMQDADGRPLEVIELPMPPPVRNGAGDRLPASHMNFYICNAGTCVPIFGGETDEEALRTIARCLPDRPVIPIRCERLVEGLGSLHCMSQQVPE
jgi:agmatine deiminase